jgi:hypothetical protein
MVAIAPTETVTVQLPANLYKDIGEFLSISGKVNLAAIDRFIEAAVSNYLIRQSTKELHAATAHIPEEDLADWAKGTIDLARAER